MNELLPLLNPIRDYSVEDAMKMAQFILAERIKLYGELADLTEHNRQLLKIYYKLTQSIESIKKMALTKEMFVCEAIKPNARYQLNTVGMEPMDAYEAAQSKVLLAEFYGIGNIFKLNRGEKLRNEELTIVFMDDNEVSIRFVDFKWVLSNATIADVMAAQYIYNRTAAAKIELKWTENILKLLIK